MKFKQNLWTSFDYSKKFKKMIGSTPVLLKGKIRVSKGIELDNIIIVPIRVSDMPLFL